MTFMDLSDTYIQETPKAQFPEDKREISYATQSVIDAVVELQNAVAALPGMSFGIIQLAASTTQTVLNDAAIVADSVLLMTPTDSNDWSVDSQWYQGATAAGTLNIEHTSMSVVRNYRYLVIG